MVNDELLVKTVRKSLVTALGKTVMDEWEKCGKLEDTFATMVKLMLILVFKMLLEPRRG